jgi:hypothetical protein
MDGTAQNELAQGNSMLSDMREHNREVIRHNLATRTNFNNQILTAQRTAREAASDKKAETMGEGLGEGGAQALKIAKQGYEAYGKVASGIGFQGMGRAEVAARTVGQVFKDAPVGQAVQKGVGAAKDVAEAAKPAVAAVAKTGMLGTSAQTAARNVDMESSTAATLGKVAPKAPFGLTAAGPESALKTAAPKAAGIGGKLGAGIDIAEKGGALLSVATGGLDAIEDAVSGHIMGHNAASKHGNELGIAGGVASLAGFLVPGMGLIGAGLGIASGVESMIGAEKHSEKEISTTLPAEEKEEEETTVKYAGPTAGSTGQVTQQQTTAIAKTGGAGATAF